MRTGPLVDALIEQMVDDLGRYALENGFHVVVEGAVLARADPRAHGGLQLDDRRGGQAGHQGRSGPLAPETTLVLRRPRASLPTGSRTTDRAGLAHRARDDGDGMTEREVRSCHGEAGSPTP
jgi:hypothetical protein